MGNLSRSSSDNNDFSLDNLRTGFNNETPISTGRSFTFFAYMAQQQLARDVSKVEVIEPADGNAVVRLQFYCHNSNSADKLSTVMKDAGVNPERNFDDKTQTQTLILDFSTLSAKKADQTLANVCYALVQHAQNDKEAQKAFWRNIMIGVGISAALSVIIAGIIILTQNETAKADAIFRNKAAIDEPTITQWVEQKQCFVEPNPHREEDGANQIRCNPNEAAISAKEKAEREEAKSVLKLRDCIIIDTDFPGKHPLVSSCKLKKTSGVPLTSVFAQAANDEAQPAITNSPRVAIARRAFSL